MIKHRKIENESENIMQIKADLLWNMTLDFKLALKNKYLPSEMTEQILSIDRQ